MYYLSSYLVAVVETPLLDFGAVVVVPVVIEPELLVAVGWAPVLVEIVKCVVFAVV